MQGRIIYGNCFTQAQFCEARQSIKSGTVIDCVKQGYVPNLVPGGILCTFHDMPVASYDKPTLNDVVFSTQLWKGVMENPQLQAVMNAHAYWGELGHPKVDAAPPPQPQQSAFGQPPAAPQQTVPESTLTVDLRNVSNRVDSLRFGPDNLILGDVSITDTPSGWIVYSLCKSGKVGVSSRGAGALEPRNNDGHMYVVEQGYLGVCFDNVSLPAVPEAFDGFQPHAGDGTLKVASSADPLATAQGIAALAASSGQMAALERVVSMCMDRFFADPRFAGLNEILNSGKTVTVPLSRTPHTVIRRAAVMPSSADVAGALSRARGL